MKSSRDCSNESAKAMGNGQPNLQTMNDLYSLELSQVLLQAVDAGRLQPEERDGGGVFHVSMCPTHAMVNLPKCLMCIEAGDTAATIAA
jgi:hypothetical protein